jgi:hypothetical protein
MTPLPLTTRRLLALLATAAIGVGAGRTLSAQPPTHAFTWFAELVSADRAARTVTVKARVEPHVARTFKMLTPGTPVALVWSQFGGEADAIRYIERADALPAESGGYIVRGQIVASDAAGKTLTFATPASDKVLAALASAKAGTPIRMTASMVEAPASAVMLNEVAKPRPVALVAADQDVDVANAAGTWLVETSIMSNPIKLKCPLVQERAKLTGSCGGPPLGEVTLTKGGVKDRTVSFQFDVTSFGPALVLSLKGELDAAGTAMKGMVSVSGFDAPFTAVKQ